MDNSIIGVAPIIEYDALQVGENTIQLSVTDASGETDEDQVLIYVEPLKDPGFVVGQVTGHTATVGSSAVFTVALTSQPTSDVVIELSVSDPLEATLTRESISFTPSNWMLAKAITVYGVNPDVVNGQQNYSVMLKPAVSNDINYRGLDPTDVSMYGIRLSTEDTGEPILWLSDIDYGFMPTIFYNGSKSLQHSLSGGPPGISVDEINGTLRWVAPESSEGEIIDVETQHTVDNLAYYTTTTLKVANSKKVEIDLIDGFSTVRDPDSNLDGFLFHAGDSAVDSPLVLKEVTGADLPTLPVGVSRVSSGFYSVSDTSTDVYVPIASLNLSEINSLEIYKWSPSQYIWLPVSLDWDVVSKDGIDFVRLPVASLHGLSFVGTQAVSSKKVVNAGIQFKESTSFDPVGKLCIPKISILSQYNWENG